MGDWDHPPICTRWGSCSTGWSPAAGRPPFDPKQPLQALWHQHLVDPPPGLTGVPEALAGVIARALAKDPAERWVTAAAFADDLARTATSLYGRGWTASTGIQLHLTDTLRRTIDPPTTRNGH